MSDSELARVWRDLLERYHSTAAALERALNDRHGLGVSEYEVLEWLVESVPDEDHCRVQTLAAGLHLSQSALSRAIARLEGEGLVARAMCPEDRRGIYVHLTDAGRARHAQARPTQRAVLAAQLSRSPPSPASRPSAKAPGPKRRSAARTR